MAAVSWLRMVISAVGTVEVRAASSDGKGGEVCGIAGGCRINDLKGCVSGSVIPLHSPGHQVPSATMGFWVGEFWGGNTSKVTGGGSKGARVARAHQIFFMDTFLHRRVIVGYACAPPYEPTNSAPGIPFLHILANVCYFCLSDTEPSKQREAIPQCCFDLRFPDDY